jgi:hypothetical protein
MSAILAGQALPAGGLTTAPLLGGLGFFFFALDVGLEAHFVLDQFQQGDIGGAEVAGLIDQRTAVATAGGQLPDAPGDEVHKDIGIPHLGQGLFYKFAVHEPLRLLPLERNATTKQYKNRGFLRGNFASVTLLG